MHICTNYASKLASIVIILHTLIMFSLAAICSDWQYPSLMAWRRIGDKQLSETMLTWLTDAYMRHRGWRWGGVGVWMGGGRGGGLGGGGEVGVGEAWGVGGGLGLGWGGGGMMVVGWWWRWWWWWWWWWGVGMILNSLPFGVCFEFKMVIMTLIRNTVSSLI